TLDSRALAVKLNGALRLAWVELQAADRGGVDAGASVHDARIEQHVRRQGRGVAGKRGHVLLLVGTKISEQAGPDDEIIHHALDEHVLVSRLAELRHRVAGALA